MLHEEVIAMSGPMLMVTLGAVWLAIGLVLSLVLGRRGHDGFSWLAIGTVLGPLAVVLAFDAVQNDEPAEPIATTAGTRSRTGAIDVLVGADGSPEARAALQSAVELLGPSLGRVTLVRVVSFDCRPEDSRKAAEAVEREARLYPRLEPGTEVVRGAPARVLAARAAEGGYDVLVIGSRGEGRHLFGSAARELASESPVPVLLNGARIETAGTDAPDAAAEPQRIP